MITDHLGNIYKSKAVMCHTYGISVPIFDSRILSGKSLAQALLGNSDNYVVQDHVGREFPSLKKMCHHYNITVTTYKKYINKPGWTLERVLSEAPKRHDRLLPDPKYPDNSQVVIEESVHFPEGPYAVRDHLGNIFPSQREMCEHYGVFPSAFCKRISRGYSLQEALTHKKGVALRQKKMSISDHLGNKYSSLSEMCSAYKITRNVYNYRIHCGLTVEEALTKPVSSKCIQDHLGHSFRSQQEMCDFHGVNIHTFRKKKSQGYSLEEALAPIQKETIRRGNEGHPTIDHLGNSYDSLTAMCNAYGVTLSAYRYRIQHGWSVETALQHKPTKREPVQDHLGNTFSSQADMCKHHHVAQSLFCLRISQGYSLAEALLGKPSVPKVVDHLGNTYSSLAALCAAYSINPSTYYGRIYRGWSLEQALTKPTDM